VRFAFIDAKKAEHDVAILCRVLQVQRSGYYAWCSREEPEREREDRRLVVELRAVFVEKKRRYGSPRLCRELRTRGTYVGRHRVARLMTGAGASSDTCPLPAALRGVAVSLT
jgi:hypothetical protein